MKQDRHLTPQFPFRIGDFGFGIGFSFGIGFVSDLDFEFVSDFELRIYSLRCSQAGKAAVC